MEKIVKIDKKHKGVTVNFFYGNQVKCSFKKIKKILGKITHTGDECEFLSSSVEWVKMLKSDEDIIPFKVYDYWFSHVLEDENLVVPWRISVEWDKKYNGERVMKYIKSKLYDLREKKSKKNVGSTVQNISSTK